MMAEHLTNGQLQEAVDGILADEEAANVRAHLNLCSQCSNMYQDMLKVHHALQQVPDERVAADFARTVLEKLNIVPRTSLLFRIAENAAYVFGLMIVLGVMLSIFIIAGVISKDQLSHTQTSLDEAGGWVVSHFNGAFDSLSAALQAYLPFVFGNGNLKIVVMGTLIVGMLGLLDRALKKRMLP